ncbi:MAG: hypothetical protein LH491_02220 [Pseudoxanthomonas sp.]|nr:hypothetical protein [Pseudoxanthomonas sp.]
MSVHSFRFDTSRMRSAFSPRKPRNPLLRVVFGIAGLALLGLLIFLSVFVGAAMIAAGLSWKLLSQRGRRSAVQDLNVVEGEFQVVRKPVLPHSP